MGEMKEFNLDEISLFSILRDVVKIYWVILLAAVTAWFAVTGVEGLIYVPEYTATATLAVSARGSSSNAYSSLTLTNQMAGVFSEVFDSNVLRERIRGGSGAGEHRGRDFLCHHRGDQSDHLKRDLGQSPAGLPDHPVCHRKLRQCVGLPFFQRRAADGTGAHRADFALQCAEPVPDP